MGFAAQCWGIHILVRLEPAGCGIIRERALPNVIGVISCGIFLRDLYTAHRSIIEVLVDLRDVKKGNVPAEIAE